jgi:cytochrome c-type protein NapC
MLGTTAITLAIIIIDIALIALIFAKRSITTTPSGKALTFITLFIFPVMSVWMGVSEHMERSKTTEFCLSCHVMKDYGKSLHADDRGFIPATHFQNHLVPSDKACFTCHTDYTMFGDLKAKMRGVKHLYVQYFGTVPKQVKLYNAYNNRECLHCHSGARSFEEGATHNQEPGRLEMIKANKLSCLSSECHNSTHSIDQLNTITMWKENLK